MSLSAVRLGLLIGQAVPRPAPAELLTALESVEVNQSDDGSAGFGQGFQMVLRAHRDKAVASQYALVKHPLLQPGSRVVISVTLGALPQVLIDGIITHHQFTPGPEARLVVSGQDLSVLMDMVEMGLPYPALGHTAIVALILAKYAALGILPMIVPPLSEWTTTPLDQVPFQEGTDRTYLRSLAQEHGYIFGLRPGPAPMANLAYWGPLIKLSPPQKALNVDAGASTNVETISFAYDALAPEQVYGLVHLRDAQLPVPVLSLINLDLPPLAGKPALIANQPFVRKTRLAYQGTSAIAAYAEAQSRTNRSAAGIVVGTGTLNALRYRALLTAPGIVGLRGAGQDYDGYYYVQNVKHQISAGEYKQAFTLVREGVGTLTQRV